MRKALVVGIDHYKHLDPLGGCVNDAHDVRAMLERHADGRVNFPTPRLLLGSGPADIVERGELKDAVRELFADDAEIALLYFSGHGCLEDTGGFLCAGDCRSGDDGLPISEIMTIAGESNARNKIIILDSCHSGIAGERPRMKGVAEIDDGMTILTASSADQSAFEENGGGVFTSLLVDALGGAAANLVGDVTPGSIYAHIDQSLGPWGGQRPVFKVESGGGAVSCGSPVGLTGRSVSTPCSSNRTCGFPCIRLSDKTSRLRPRRASAKLGETYEPKLLVQVLVQICPSAVSHFLMLGP